MVTVLTKEGMAVAWEGPFAVLKKVEAVEVAAKELESEEGFALGSWSCVAEVWERVRWVGAEWVVVGVEFAE